MATSGVQDIDHGWAAVQEMLRGISDAHVTVGLHSDAAPYEAGRGEAANVAQIASFHEFGQGVPQRSFFRPTMDANRDKYFALQERICRLILDRKINLQKGLSLVGLKVVVDIKQAITDLTDPPLAESTIRRKADKGGLKGTKREKYMAPKSAGGNAGDPLVDTSHMRQSVTYDVRIDGASVEHPQSVKGGE
jgi:hypothetical protein